MITKKTYSEDLMKQFWGAYLVKPLVQAYADPVEKHREMAISITLRMVEMLGFNEESQFIIPSIVSRMEAIPYAEPCKLTLTSS